MSTPITITHAPVTGPVTHCLSDVAIPPLPLARQRRHDPYGLHRITEQTSEVFGISVKKLTSKARPDAIAYPRQVAMYLATRYSNASLVAIGRHFGRKFQTVAYAREIIEDKMAASDLVKTQVQTVIERL
jgi:chromosomal replication initiation ATPase DnaA